jgi:hypothetical protein
MPRCEGCSKKKKHKKLKVWDGLFGSLLLCWKCFNWAYAYNAKNEEASFNVVMDDLEDDI